ncbi:MAG: hypothetical protein ABSA77_05200 [Thermoguttaceae bacterium]
MSLLLMYWQYWLLAAIAFVFLILLLPSIRIIGPTEVGLVTKRFSFKKLPEDNPIAFRGEAGYQADLLMPGWHFKLWIIYAVEKYPWVQVRAGEIGVVVSQVGRALPIGAKSAESLSELNLRQSDAGASGRLFGHHSRAHLRASCCPGVSAHADQGQTQLRVFWIERGATQGYGNHTALD